MRQTGGADAGETSTRSSPFSSASASAADGVMIPSCPPSSSITRISRARIRSLTRILVSMDVLHLLHVVESEAYPKPSRLESPCDEQIGQHGLEVGQRHGAAVSFAAAAHGHGAVLRLAVAHHQHEGDLGELR